MNGYSADAGALGPSMTVRWRANARAVAHSDSRGVRWDVVAAMLAVVVAISGLAPLALVGGAVDDRIGVVVRELPGTGSAPEETVRRSGGTVDRQLPLINGFAASLSTDGIAALARTAGVAAITPDSQVTLSMAGDGYDSLANFGSMYNIAESVGATKLWRKGITGQGVDIAVLDSGVSDLPEFAGRLIQGPDLSFESQNPEKRYVDTYGHGTHMASIAAGRDDRLPAGASFDNPDYFVGIAPESRIVALKLAGQSGVTDVSQVIAALDWVVQYRNSNGLNIRVINLSFGTDGTQDYVLDPLAFAVERAWHAGIFVSVSAGNQGYGTAKMDNPAYDPFVMAVGSNNLNGTLDAADDFVPDFSSRGNAGRRPDIVAPGKSVIGLRVRGSFLDTKYPEGRVGDRYFKGSGTSQSAAVVSGAAALLLSARPSLTPDQVKKLLMSTATPMPAADAEGRGSGRVDVAAAADAPAPDFVQGFVKATGLGSIALARGTAVIKAGNGVKLDKDVDIFGQTYNVAMSGNRWSDGSWNGNRWSGNSWSGNRWSGNSWSGNSWSGNSWSAGAWEGNSWSCSAWSGAVWSSAGGN